MRQSYKFNLYFLFDRDRFRCRWRSGTRIPLEGLYLERVLTGGLCFEVEGLDRDSSEDFELSEELHDLLLITGDLEGDRFLIGDLPEKSSLDLTGS